MSHSIKFYRHRLAGSSPGVVAILLLACAAAGSPAAYAADKPKQQEISRVIAKEFNAAQKAMAANQWSEMLKNLEAAETKSPLTAFDKKSIYEYKGFAYVKMNNLKAAQAAYEAEIATGGESPEEAAKTYHMLFQLAASNQSPKALEYGKQFAESGTASPNDLLIMSQLYYQQKNCKESTAYGDKAIAAFKKAGEAPKEVLYQIKLQCASDASDAAAEAAALYDLVRLTNKTAYWNNLIRLERQDERDDHNTLMIYRVMYDTASMNADSDYIEMAQLLGDASLPGEAQMVLEKLMTSGLLKDDHKERTTRLLNSLKSRAETDKKSLPQLDAEATKNPAGQLDVKLGEVYFGGGDYQGAVTAINRGIQKGSVKNLDEAYVYLGRAQAALKNYAEAKKAFVALKTVPNISPRVLKLWELYADKVGQPFT
jgi:tetratricopeptide (TPR) repeat protein